jgi:hypothetical protein
MNTTYLTIITALIICFIVYFLSVRKATKKLLIKNATLREALAKLLIEHRILVDQYRQLANINKALRDVRPAVANATVKNYKKK